MKILCPIDFSSASVNAANWIAAFLEFLEDGELHLIHSVNTKKRGSMFLNIEDILFEKAEIDMQQLLSDLETNFKKVNFSSKIYISDPKSLIVALCNKGEYDWVVTGTKGLSSLKDMTIGSVTEYIINNVKIPVLAIPEESAFNKFEKMVLGVDDKILEEGAVLETLKSLCNLFDAELFMVHVKQPGDSTFEYDPAMDIYLDNINYQYRSLDNTTSVSNTISEYCHYIGADLVCMIHRKKNWLERLFALSMTKKELFHINTPFLVLHADH